MNTIDLYNQLATKTKGYLATGRSFSFNPFLFKKIFKDIDSKLHFQKDDCVLDLGGGTGEITKFIKIKSRNVILLDGAEEAVKIASRKCNAICAVYNLKDPLYYTGFNKVLCYSVAPFLESRDEFEDLVKKLLHATLPGGLILIGDIPMSDKENTKPDRNLTYAVRCLAVKFRKTITRFLRRKIPASEIKGISYTRGMIREIMDKYDVEYQIMEQAKGLPFSHLREDLLIKV